ncbi:MAG TPA: D-cysteine desulfhydrase family protein [Chloroflexota bacterium]|nr:D-cysteine desulfhydrase family protein [Chloroflexota bacterium]
MSLGSQPRFPLAVLPTPLQEARRLRAALGGPQRCPRILIKRDDLTGLAFGGNKARKLEFLVADALKQQATVLVTCGAAQSNHARMTAAAACMAGLGASLVLTGHADEALQGNLLLDHLLGAEVHFVAPNEDRAIATGDEQDAMIAAVMEALRARGERPYLIPVGGSSPVGTLGYVAGTLELVGQLAAMGEEPSHLYYASGSRSTQAGLELGKRLFSAPYRLQGIAVSGGEPQKTEKAVRLANEAAEIVGSAVRLVPEDLRTDQAYIGEGYGIATPACLEALSLLARHEGIFLDPTYTAKAMAGLIDHIRRGLIAPSETVIFLHTGGTPALFAKVDQMSSLLNTPARVEGALHAASPR